MSQYKKLQKFVSINPTFTLSQIASELNCSEQYCRQLIYKAINDKLVKSCGKGVWKSIHVTEPVQEKSSLQVSERFEYIEDLVHMVAKKIQPSILLTGTSGVGKSYLVKKTLESAGLEDGVDFFVIKGQASPLGLYQLLHDKRDALLIFDDCDSVFKDDKSANLLKAALDSYDKRYIHWHSNKAEQLQLESHFEFTGQVIFISNYSANRIDDAIRSRAFCYNLHLTPNEVHEYMSDILPNICPEVNIDIKKEVLNYLGQFKHTWSNYNLRTLIQAIRIRLGVRPDKDWKVMIQVLSNGE